MVADRFINLGHALLGGALVRSHSGREDYAGPALATDLACNEIETMRVELVLIENRMRIA